MNSQSFAQERPPKLEEGLQERASGRAQSVDRQVLRLGARLRVHKQFRGIDQEASTEDFENSLVRSQSRKRPRFSGLFANLLGLLQQDGGDLW